MPERMICVKQGAWRNALGEVVNGPKYLEEVTILDEVPGWDLGQGDRYYILQGHWQRDDEKFHCSRFRPLPDISELQSLLTTIPKELEPTC